MSAHQIETWIEDLGGRVIAFLYDPASPGGGAWGYATVPDLRLRYSWEMIHFGYEPTFDRWTNSVDHACQIPTTKDELAAIFADVVRRGKAGEFGKPFGNDDA